MIAGRAPYGYRLGGERGRPALEPDPLTAPVVRRIFDEYVAGSGLQLIAERLTADGILRPSAYDPMRNPHHHGTAWSKAAVRAVITNGRYAGGLVPGGVYQRAQELLAERSVSAGSAGRYVLRGRLRCGVCLRLMQGSWNNHTAYYRCRFPREYARANSIEHPANVYLREDRLLEPMLSWICRSLPPHLYAWAARQSPVTRTRLVARCHGLRGLVGECWRNRLRVVELAGAMDLLLVYEPGDNAVQIHTEIVPGATVRDQLAL
jgi:site-specific DNA recombinase